MTIGVLKETKNKEKRVALTPDVVKKLIKKEFKIVIEEKAGFESGFMDQDYTDVGATIGNQSEVVQADVVLKVNAAKIEEAEDMKEGAVWISLLYAYDHPKLIEVFKKKKISAFAMDAIPRISRAQKMDALSSQANLGGYKAVVMAADALGKIFPLMMTAAGTITPAKVMIFGAGVAGLQAVATAKRLGAVVEVSDVRPETKEQVESLGGRFLSVEGEEAETEGGYAKEVSDEFLAKQQELIKERIKEVDIVITTALVRGKKSPVLVSEEMVKSMRPGSVIVDMAVETGGNCALSEYGKTIVKDNVTIIGEPNLPSLLATDASALYATNISSFLTHLATPEGFKWDMDEEITKGALITHQGELIHEFTKTILSQKQ